LANPKIERPPVFFRDPMTQDVFVADFDPNTGAYGIENAVPIGPDGEDIVPLVHDPEKFQQWVIDWEAVDEGAGIKPVDTPTEQDEPSLVHEWQLTRLERLEAKLDRIIAHLGL
jgi:hypothetical protein